MKDEEWKINKIHRYSPVCIPKLHVYKTTQTLNIDIKVVNRMKEEE